MTAIKVENLGKRYVIDHQKKQSRYQYETLSGAMANFGKRAFNTLRHPLSGFDNRLEHEEYWALKDINFEINQGDRVGIIGRNGAGKSTLLKILSRITAPTTGKITIKGRVSSLLEVGTGFHPELTGRENIYLNGAILGMKRQEIKAKFDEIVAFAEVEKFLDTPVKHYSSGMYVRLAFAVAAHLEPEILIVDEVLAVGDAQFQKKCLGKMEEVGKEGRTVLFVSHNMAALQTLCTNAILISNGVIRSQGGIAEQFDNYLNGVPLTNSIGNSSKIKCGADILVSRLEFSPNPVRSKEDVSFVIELISTRTVNISALALLIYSKIGERIAILDLRKQDGKYELTNENPLLVEGIISKIPLVEGDYNVGLYVDYGVFQDNLLDLVNLTVSCRILNCNLTPFHPSVRGFVEIDFSI